MKFSRMLALAGMLLSLSEAATAQLPPASPEIYAAYCLGMLDEDIASLQAGIRARDPISLAIFPMLMAQEQTTRRKYSLYLVANGTLSGPTLSSAEIGIMMANKRGHDELRQCDALITANAQANKYGSELFPPICRRLDQCRDPSKLLPFPYGQ